MSDKEFIKLCGICGDRATGYNFNAITCESCKAFFRRNAPKFETLKCHFDGDCRIDSVSRKFCKKCRLNKCFEIGMKKEWILNEEQKHLRKIKIDSNKQTKKRRKNSEESTKLIDSSSSSTHESTELDANDSMDILDIDKINNEIQKIENYIQSDQISDIVYKKAIELEFTPIPIARPLSDYRTTFNELEGNRLSELLSAIHIMKCPLVPITSEAMTIDDGCKVWSFKFEQDIKKIVKMSKCLTAFQHICENDQLALIKYGCIEIYCMRLAMYFNFDKEYWTLVTDNNNSTLLKLDTFKENKMELYLAYKKYLRKLQYEWDSDAVIIDLLTAIVLFNPDRPNLLHKEHVKLQQQIYMYLLQRYLQMKYQSECESKSKFLRLINTLIDLNVLHNIHKQCYLQREPVWMGPLLKEIVDMKPMIADKPVNLLVF